MHKVFFSWQSDTDAAVGRLLLQKALKKAIQRLDLDMELDEATRDQPGSPILFEGIRRKIEGCEIFVPDLTFIGTSHDDKKWLPNPNVLVEYGYALAKRPEETILPVINLHFGDIDHLPFDIRYRSVNIQYRLSPSSEQSEQEAALQELCSQFEIELRLAFDRSFHGLSPEALRIARFFSDSSESGWGGHGEHEVDDIAANLNMEAGQINKLLRHLEALGYVSRLAIAGTDAPPAIPTDRLFWDFDLRVKGWNPRHDARTVLETMLQGDRKGESCATLAKELSWDTRRINPALRYIVSGKLVLASDIISYPLAYPT